MVEYQASKHMTPRRRLTRQRSGFGVNGEHSGNECRIVRAVKFEVAEELGIRSRLSEVNVTRQFGEDLGIVGAGAFLRSDEDATLTATVTVDTPTGSHSKQLSMEVTACQWVKFGVHVEFPMDGEDLIEVGAEFSLALASPDGGRVVAEIFGLNFDGVGFYENHPELRETFLEKTSLYEPEIYFFDHDEPLHIEVDYSNRADVTDGAPLLLKACNRCERYLPVDLDQERNPLSFSNHCVKRAPCAHESFARYEIQNQKEAADLLSIKPVDSHVVHRDDGELRIGTHYGFQLECRVCKKYFVNAPLNPMRSATQHREDGLRRRAVEDLLMELLGHPWIYKGFYLQTGREFDDHVWEAFGKACFRCGAPLPTTSDMALDHTMPLAYLWPLCENATCLCPTCNSQKHDLFPAEFYNPEQLARLAEITGIPLARLANAKKEVNAAAVERLVARIDWFFDTFLAKADYQKIRDDKLTADLICASLQRVLRECATGVDLVDAYRSQTGHAPSTISIR